MTEVPQIFGFAPGSVLRVFGMRRSGNHAIINWLLRNASAQTVFLNNCRQHQSALETFQACEANGKRVDNRSDARGVLEREIADGAMLLMSYEDFIPSGDDGALDQATQGVAAADVTHEILIYRSFMNWSASLLKKLQLNEKAGYTALARLRVTIGALERYTSMLELVERPKAPNMTIIYYDRWCASSEYREAILRQLGLECRDNDLGQVQQYGGGSSFQKTAQSAADLTVLERWSAMQGDPEYQIVLNAAQQDARLMDVMKRLMPQEAARAAKSVEQRATRSGWLKDLLNPRRPVRVR